jgi:hypothetical protein
MKKASAAAPILPKIGIITRPKDEHPAQAQEATPRAEPENSEPLTRFTIRTANTFMLATIPMSTAAIFVTKNSIILSLGK